MEHELSNAVFHVREAVRKREPSKHPDRLGLNIVQPRIGMTYTVDPDTVLRASYGKYNEQPSSAYEQYNSLEQNLPDTLSQFYSLGFDTPGHAVAPSISFNSDFSLEHHFKGTDMSFKLSPFLRQTQNRVENFYINYATGLTSGLNAGNQTSSGVEFQFNKGDFARTASRPNSRLLIRTPT